MAESPVTQEQLSATIEPIKEDIGEIKDSVAVIPALLVQVQGINGTTTENSKAISDLQRWKWTLAGAGSSVGTFSILLGIILGLIRLGIL